MNTMTAVRISTAVLGLGLAPFMAAPCQAQTEVAPDFYEAASLAVVSPAPQQIAASRQQTDLQFHGSFTLPYNVECSGKTLPAGEYSVVLQPGPAQRFVTLLHNGKTIRLRARVRSEYSAPGESSLLVSRHERSRRLEAIYVQELNVILYFRPEGISYISGNAIRAERVPIS
jgi:hypothetical protein